MLGEIAILVSLLGVVAVGLGVWIGYRGWFRRVGDHEYCTQCGFDLSGTSERRICRECGAETRLTAQFVRGARTRNPRALAAGSIAAGFGVIVMLVGSALHRSGDAWWLGAQPTWWLLGVERPLAAPEDGASVIQEIVRRWNAGGVSDTQLRDLARAVLERTEDPAYEITFTDALVFKTAWSASLLTDAELRPLFREAAAYDLAHLGINGAGEFTGQFVPPRARLHMLDRGGSPASLGMRVVVEFVEAALDGESITVEDPFSASGAMMISVDGRWFNAAGALEVTFGSRVTRGAHRLHLTTRTIVYNADGSVSDHWPGTIECTFERRGERHEIMPIDDVDAP